MTNKQKFRQLENDLKWVLIDFDDTICNNSGYPKFEPTKPKDGVMAALALIESRGWKITVYTARPWRDYQLIEDWMNYYNLPFRRIICGKPIAKWVIDDRNIEFNGNWKQVIKKMK